MELRGLRTGEVEVPRRWTGPRTETCVGSREPAQGRMTDPEPPGFRAGYLRFCHRVRGRPCVLTLTMSLRALRSLLRSGRTVAEGSWFRASKSAVVLA